MPVHNYARGDFSLYVDVEDRSPDSELPPIYNYDDALKAAQALDRKYHHKRAVCLYEFGSFRSNNKQRTELLEIWWNSAWNEDRAPKQRGYGFYVPEVGRKRWVEYEPDLSAGPPDEAIDDEDTERPLEASGHFQLKDKVDDEDPVWTDFSDFDSVLSKAREISRDSTRSVSIYEWARFNVEGEPRHDLIEFWWNESLNELNCAAPKARGIGLAYREDKSPVFVRYTPSSPGGSAEVADDADSNDEAAVDDASDEEYVKTHCEDCGKIMPLYEKFEYEYEEQAGRTSGSVRVGASSRRRSSSGGRHSYSSGSSSSYSTGRTYYATRTLVLCEDCFDGRVAADEEAAKWTMVDWAVVIGVGIFVLVAGFVVVAMFRH